jgi:hypothetical protein
MNLIYGLILAGFVTIYTGPGIITHDSMQIQLGADMASQKVTSFINNVVADEAPREAIKFFFDANAKSWK